MFESLIPYLVVSDHKQFEILKVDLTNSFDSLLSDLIIRNQECLQKLPVAPCNHNHGIIIETHGDYYQASQKGTLEG